MDNYDVKFPRINGGFWGFEHLQVGFFKELKA